MQKSNANKQAVFTDCFNTLLCRTKHPDDVLFDWAKRLHSIYSNIKSENFFKMFKSAWAEIERRDVIECENSEFLTEIHEIYKLMAGQIAKYKMLDNFDENKFINDAFEAYFNAESSSHYLKKSIVKYLRKQKSLGKKIYLVSDFYCTKEVMQKWLAIAGIEESFFDDIFVSCDYKKSKKTGSLYAEILDRLKLSPKSVTMIGDNLISDRKMARKNKLKTKFAMLYFGRKSRQLKKIKQKLYIPEEYFDVFNENTKYNIYINHAFPLYLFTKRLFDHCERHEIKDVFFLAREGKLLKVLFDEYLKAHSADISTHYFVASRSSLINATLLPYEKKLKKLANWSFISPRNFMLSLNFPRQKITEICDKININEKAISFNFAKSKAYNKLINSAEFNDYYIPYCEGQNYALWQYLKQFGVTPETEKMFIVDSGWHGTMQRFLGWFLNDKVDVSGGYVGTDFKDAPSNKNYSLLFATKLKMGFTNKVLSYRWLNYEEVLRTEDGSCKGYDVTTYKPIFQDKSKETQCYDKYLKDFQEKIIQSFLKIMKIDDEKYSNLESVTAYMFYKMLTGAKSRDRKWYDAVQATYSDSFGFVGYSYRYFSGFIRRLNFRIRDLNFKLKYKRAFSKKRLYWR
ncbi:MAG: HAD family hydrolase [Clostridia bacterium]|nr:HAD family hydrolase [Clostridia bacterium]